MHSGVLIGDAKGVSVENVRVYNNQIEVLSIGISLWRNALIDYNAWLKSVEIYNNSIRITDGPSFNNRKLGINCSVSRNTSNIYVYNNNIEILTSEIKSTGIYFGSTMTNEKLDKLYISNNTILNFTFGVSNGDLQKGELGEISITNNHINNSLTTIYSTYGIRFIREKRNSLRKVIIKENLIQNINYGVYLKGYINSLDYNKSDTIINSISEFIHQNLQIEQVL